MPARPTAHANEPHHRAPLNRSCLALGVFAGGAAVAAQAQEPLELGEVSVTASGYEQQVEDAPASISVISREELEGKRYGDVTDALRTVPGVTVTGGGAGDDGADISIRGMPAEYTKILVDGRPVDTRETRPNGSAGFEQHWLPPPQAIERIEVIRGPMSTLYGSDAIGGVVNVITRKVPEQWHGSLQFSQTLQQDSDSGGSHEGSFYAGGPLSAGLLGAQIFGEYGAREEDDIVNGYEERALKQVTTRFTLTPHRDHEITLEGGFTEQNRQSTVGKTVPVTGCRGGCEDADDTYTHEHYTLSHTGHFSLGTLDTYVKREIAENRARDMEITNTDAQSSFVMPLGDHIVTLGASYSLEELHDGTSNQISDRTEIDDYKYAVFVEDEWLMTESFSLTGGLRLDDDENFGSHVSPRLYGVWNFRPNWTLKGGASTGYRSPGLRELTPDWGQVSRGGDIFGNPDLEPETSLNKELALLYSQPAGLDASLTVFHNDFEDKITRVECPASICPGGPNQFGSNPTYRVNVDEAVTRGVEVSLDAPLTDTLEFSASYTYTDSERKTGEYVGQPLTQLPRHQATAELEWQATSRLSSWTRVTYRGEERQPVEGPSRGSLVAPSYTFVDLGVGYRLTESTRVSAALYNLFDEDVTFDEYGYVEDGRRLWLSINVDF